MATALKLVTTNPGRPVLAIVKALGLDSVKIAAKRKSGRGAASKVGAQAVTTNDGSIQEGSRNNTLLSFGGSMRRKGMSQEAIEATLQAVNQANCKPPLAPEEVNAIAASLMRYPAADADNVLKSLTDTGNAARFGARYADQVKYVFGLGWVIWDGLRWKRDETDQIIELAKTLARDIYKEGEALDDSARVWVAKCVFQPIVDGISG